MPSHTAREREPELELWDVRSLSDCLEIFYYVLLWWMTIVKPWILGLMSEI
jgi:hypothetical protein